MTNPKAKTYHLTDDGMAQLRQLPAFASLPDNVRQQLEHDLPDAFGGMNRVPATRLRTKLDDILGSEADDELRGAIKGVLVVEIAPAVPD